MSLIAVVLILALVGAVVWLILQIPMPQVFRNVIVGVVVIFLVLWLLQVLGVSTGLPRLRLT